MTTPITGWQPRRHAHAAGESWRKWGEPELEPVVPTAVRYQAHPTTPDETYLVRPDSARRDVAAAALAIATLLVLAFLASWQPFGPVPS